MQPFVLLSVISLIFFTLSIITFKLTAKYSMPNPYAYFFYYFLIYFVLGLFLPIFQPINVVPKDWSVLLYNIPYAIFIYIGIFCFSLALYKLDVTTISPIGNLSNFFTPILAMIFLGEAILLKNVPWMILIVIAGFFAGYDEKLKAKSLFNKYIFLMIIFTFCVSATRIFARFGMDAVGYWNFTFYEFAYMSAGILLLLPFLFKYLKVGIRPILFLALGVLLEFLGLMAMLRAFSYQITVPSIITSIPLSSIVVILIAKINKNLLENHPIKTYLVRFSAILAMTVGVIAMVVG